MKILLTGFLALISVNLMAQSKIRFSSQNYITLLQGERGSFFGVQTINGLKYKTWFTGLGTGVDWYYQRSIPVFLSLNEDIPAKGSRNFFIATRVGVNCPWQKTGYYDEWGYKLLVVLPRLYWEAGLGYRIGIGKSKKALLLELDFSEKYSRENVQYISFAPLLLLPQPLENNHIDYRLRRLSLKAGWSF